MPQVRGYRWPWVLLALVYAVSPVDLLPEAIFPVLGYLDDAGVVAAAITWWIRSRRRASLSSGEKSPN